MPGAREPFPTAAEPGADADGERGAAETNGEQRRFWRADVEDFDQTVGLTVADAYLRRVSVSPDITGATGSAGFDDTFMESQQDTEVFELTVQVASADFDIGSDAVQALRVPRTGPSLAPATFTVSPRHAGACLLTATVHVDGNFLTNLDLTLPVPTLPKAPLLKRRLR